MANARREVASLAEWLAAQTEAFNQQYGEYTPGGVPLHDFLSEAAAMAQQVYGAAHAELARQAGQQCVQRGRLMADVWACYSGMVGAA